MSLSARESEIRADPRQTGSPAERPPLSTHVLDTSKGLPAGGVAVSLHKSTNDVWTLVKQSKTDGNGRCADLTSRDTFEVGCYKLRFEVGKYFAANQVSTMFPIVEITFDVKNASEHYHVPLLLSPFGFTTYRGS